MMGFVGRAYFPNNTKSQTLEGRFIISNSMNVQQQNHYPTFQAIKFQNGKVQKDFISVLKKTTF